MISLVYVSLSLVAAADRNRIVDDILAVSVSRNTQLDITGVLIVTPHHFCQLLEGPEGNVDAVMASILADPRHEAVRIVRREAISARHCPNWQMTRLNSENLGDGSIAGLIQEAHERPTPRTIRRLENLITQFASS